MPLDAPGGFGFGFISEAVRSLLALMTEAGGFGFGFISEAVQSLLALMTEGVTLSLLFIGI